MRIPARPATRSDVIHAAIVCAEAVALTWALVTVGRFSHAAARPYPRAYLRAYRTDLRMRNVEMKEKSL